MTETEFKQALATAKTAQQRYDLEKKILRDPDVNDKTARARIAALRTGGAQ